MNAAFPSWIIILFAFMLFGQTMRRIFGYRGRRWGGGRWKYEPLAGAGQEDVKRLDAALSERDMVIEDLQRRLSEMESRLDFTERLLAERHDATQLPAQ